MANMSSAVTEFSWEQSYKEHCVPLREKTKQEETNWCVQDKETFTKKWHCRKLGVSKKSSRPWCPIPTYVSTPKRYKKLLIFAYSKWTSLQELHCMTFSRQDWTLAREAWLTPYSMISVLFTVRLFLFLISLTPERIFLSVILVTPHILYSK